MKQKQQLNYKDYLVEEGSEGKIIIINNQKLELPIKVVRALLDLIDSNKEFRKNFMGGNHMYIHESANGKPNATAIIDDHIIRKSLTPGELEIEILNKKMKLDIELLYKISEDFDLEEQVTPTANSVESKKIKTLNPLASINLFSSTDAIGGIIDRLEVEKQILEELNKEYKHSENLEVVGIADLGFAMYKRIKRQDLIVMSLERMINTKSKGSERVRSEREILDYLMDQLEHTTMKSDAPKLHSKVTLIKRISVQEALFQKVIKEVEVEEVSFGSRDEERKVIAFKFDKFNSELTDLKSLLIARELKQRIPEGKIYRVSEGNLILSGEFDIVQDGIVKSCKNHYFLVIEKLNLVLDPGHSKTPIPFNSYEQNIKEWNSGKSMFIEVYLS